MVFTAPVNNRVYGVFSLANYTHTYHLKIIALYYWMNATWYGKKPYLVRKQLPKSSYFRNSFLTRRGEKWKKISQLCFFASYCCNSFLLISNKIQGCQLGVVQPTNSSQLFLKYILQTKRGSWRQQRTTKINVLVKRKE